MMNDTDVPPDDEVTPAMGTPAPVIERCTVKCDKGSQCVREKHKGGHHETEHGCICYDFPAGTRETVSPVSQK